jgi:uncharacterized protein YdiU (UPF0061 family)
MNPPKLKHIYADLGTKFSAAALPENIRSPKLLLWNDNLAEQLGLNALSNEQKGAYFSGQKMFNDARPVAMAYSGHQFGHFNPNLGDGRAHLLGELSNSNGTVHELHLKGSGRTPFSRNGDGKCGIKPAVREFIMSEAMHALGVPTTRSLAVVTTGEMIQRQTTTPGAIVTRVAKSHLRVGTFEYFAARQMTDELKVLADLAIQRHCPESADNDSSKYFNLLSYVIDKQIVLITEWMRIGFIHGVMNTDNTLLAGDTIDYGPCAMLGVYHPSTVYSSIDHQGRYAFGNQAQIAQWNLARLAECLLPLLADDEQQAIDSVMPMITGFTEKFNQSFVSMMTKKIGISIESPSSTALVEKLLNLMQKNQLDYTQTFIFLQQSLDEDAKLNPYLSRLSNWHNEWINLLENLNIPPKQAIQLMGITNPLVIPRNHHVEAVLSEIESNPDTTTIEKFLTVLKSPYSITPNTRAYQGLAADNDINYQTFCGT